MQNLKIFCTWWFLMTATMSLQATNLLFLPGDAYFMTALDPKTAAALERGEAVFAYEDFSGRVMLCGSAGYNNIRIEGMPDQGKTDLLEVYRPFLLQKHIRSSTGLPPSTRNILFAAIALCCVVAVVVAQRRKG